jgi:hypothetical protein
MLQTPHIMFLVVIQYQPETSLKPIEPVKFVPIEINPQVSSGEFGEFPSAHCRNKSKVVSYPCHTWLMDVDGS